MNGCMIELPLTIIVHMPGGFKQFEIFGRLHKKQGMFLCTIYGLRSAVKRLVVRRMKINDPICIEKGHFLYM